jgi:hypothetical protein
MNDSDSIETITISDDVKKPKKSSRIEQLRRWWRARTKRQKIIIIVAISIVVFTLGIVSAALLKPAPPEPAPEPVAIEEPAPEPTTVASRLTGVQIDKELNNLPVTAVMIENSPEARPQSGLKEAGVVFEAIAEGGITRFMALYLESKPEQIGPVRSVRPYYLDWMSGFDAAIAHVGGSGQALAQIQNEGLKSLTQFSNPGAYQRVNYRYAPHNMYTSRSQLLTVHKDNNMNTSKFTGFARKEGKPAEVPTLTEFAINPSSALYNLRYTYDKKTNSYLRFMAGQPHNDEKSGTQLNSNVVIAMVVPYSKSGIYSVYQTVGSGDAYIFQNGEMIEAIWEKRSKTENIRFGNKLGAPLGINPGQTWIIAVSDKNQVVANQ